MLKLCCQWVFRLLLLYGGLALLNALTGDRGGVLWDILSLLWVLIVLGQYLEPLREPSAANPRRARNDKLGELAQVPAVVAMIGLASIASRLLPRA